jgi:hypothetical protein
MAASPARALLACSACTALPVLPRFTGSSSKGAPKPLLTININPRETLLVACLVSSRSLLQIRPNRNVRAAMGNSPRIGPEGY